MVWFSRKLSCIWFNSLTCKLCINTEKWFSFSYWDINSLHHSSIMMWSITSKFQYTAIFGNFIMINWYISLECVTCAFVFFSGIFVFWTRCLQSDCSEWGKIKIFRTLCAVSGHKLNTDRKKRPKQIPQNSFSAKMKCSLWVNKSEFFAFLE